MFSFEPLKARHLPLLHDWIQRPHVAQWWEAPRSREDIEHEYLPIVSRELSTRAYLAVLDAEPIDQFLANANQLGQGLGTLMVKAFVEQLFLDPAVTQVQTDPSPKNQRAIRSYRKAGFVEQGEVITPDGAALLMVKHRSQPGALQ